MIKGLSSDQIFFGNGSDEPIDLLLRMFCEPGQDHIITMPPTYGMYAVSADINAVENKQVPLTSAFEIDLDKVRLSWSDNSKIIFICSPNNPSGNLLSRSSIEAILHEFPGMVVIDEAYVDFSSEESWVSRINEFPNLVVLQTLSKAWGMAGIRVGVAMGNAYVISVLDKIKPPYNLSLPNQQLALEAMTNEPKKEDYVSELLGERQRLSDVLSTVPLVKKITPSDSNFLLVQFDRAKELFDYLIQNTLIVRYRGTQLHCDGCLRITVGTQAENDEFLRLLNLFGK